MASSSRISYRPVPASPIEEPVEDRPSLSFRQTCTGGLLTFISLSVSDLERVLAIVAVLKTGIITEATGSAYIELQSSTGYATKVVGEQSSVVDDV